MNIVDLKKSKHKNISNGMKRTIFCLFWKKNIDNISSYILHQEK